MKNFFRVIFLVAAVSASAYGQANEVSYADISSDPTKYVGKRVVMNGAFAYSEPMRESFTLNQNGSPIEVFYSDLPPNVKQLILSQQKSSKEQLTVSGTLRQYTNSARSYFIIASSVQFENSSVPVPPGVNSISYSDILSNASSYVNKQVTMNGSFLFSEPMRQSFTFDQSGNQIEVLVSDLSRIDRESILSQKKYSKVPVVVTGILLGYVNNPKKYYINAYSVRVTN